ncbi:facilitated trehalose transporter Tret1-like isoform X2 [Periplaneta americana]
MADATEMEDSEVKPSKAIVPQVLLSVSCCLVGMSYGMSAGHSAVLLPHLQSANSSLVIDENTGSWIASVYAIASPVGCLLGGVSMDIWGRKKINMVGNLGMIVGWLLITFAENAAMIITGRVIEGFSRSCIATCVTVFVDELANPTFRGFIVCSMFTCVSIGIMVISSLGALVHWRVASAMAVLQSVLIVISFCFVVESPTWFVRKNRLEEAEKSLQWLWGPEKDMQVKEELNDLITRLRPKEQYQKTSIFKIQIMQTLRGVFVARIMKPFLIIHSYNILQAFCGLGILTYYTVDVISKTRESGYEILDDYSVTVLVSVVRVVTIFISSFLMLTVGRRTLSLISGTLSSAAALCLGIVLFLRHLDAGSPLLPITESKLTFSLILMYSGAMSFGFFALPSIMIGETQPSHVRGFACGYIYTINDLLLGAVVKLYPTMLATMQIHGLFLFFGVSCVVCTVFVYVFLPETQGLTLQQIEDYFRQPNVMWLTRNKYKKDEGKIEEIDVDTVRRA